MGKMLRWINDFLANRKNRVKVEDQVSDFKKKTRIDHPKGWYLVQHYSM